MNNGTDNRTSRARRSPDAVNRGTPVIRDDTAERIANRGRRNQAAASRTSAERADYASQPTEYIQTAQRGEPTRARQTSQASNRTAAGNGDRNGASRPNAAPAQNGMVRQIGAVRDPDRRIGNAQRRMTPVQRPESRTPAARDGLAPQTREEKRLVREQKRADRLERFTENHLEKWDRQEKAESRWQKDIVRVKSGVDRPLLILAIILLALGSVMVMSASYPTAVRKNLSVMYFAWRQIIFLGMGAAAMFGGYIIPYEGPRFRRVFPIIAYVLSAILLIVVIFAGISEGEAQRWILVPGVGFTVQPSEMMKLAIVMVLALYADRFRKQREDATSLGGKYLYNVLFPTFILGFSCLLVLVGRHLSGTMIVGAIGFFLVALMTDRKTPVWWVFVTVGVLLAVAAAVYIIAVPYATTRFMSIINPGADLRNDSWQSTQSLYAVGSGGLFGVGIGESRQKYSYLAASHTDFIFAIWCEEFGFIGAIALILLFLAFLWRGYRVAARARDTFTMLTAYGITTHFAIQMIGHMLVDTTYLNTGISLPFFSYGGSSLIVQMFEVGILLRISKHFYKKKSELERDELRRNAGLD